MSDAATITTVNYAQFGRVGRVEIWQDMQPIPGINTDGLDFRFQTNNMFLSNAEAAIPNDATVSVLGLSKKSVDYLCQFCDDARYLERNISVRVLAGYASDENKGLQEILHMPVWRAIPSMPPENWLTLTAKMSKRAEELKGYTFKPKKGEQSDLKTLMEDLTSEFSIKWLWTGKAFAIAQHTNVDFFCLYGGTERAVNELRMKFTGLEFVQEPLADVNTGSPYVYKVMVAKEKKDPSGGDSVKNDTGVSWEIDKNHGMIGLPSFVGGTMMTKKVNVRTLLNPSYRSGDSVFLTSEICSGLNGVYKVLSVKHTGHLRGNEWYSDLTCYQGVN